jgi:hypothetical protein
MHSRSHTRLLQFVCVLGMHADVLRSHSQPGTWDLHSACVQRRSVFALRSSAQPLLVVETQSPRTESQAGFDESEKKVDVLLCSTWTREQFVLEAPRLPLAGVKSPSTLPPTQSLTIFLCRVGSWESVPDNAKRGGEREADKRFSFSPFAFAVLNLASLRRHPLVHRLRAFIETNLMSLAKLFTSLMQGAEASILKSPLYSEFHIINILGHLLWRICGRRKTWRVVS